MKLLSFTLAMLQLSGSVMATPASEFNDIQRRADWKDETDAKFFTNIVTPSRKEWEAEAKTVTCYASTQYRKSRVGFRSGKYRIKLNCNNLGKDQIVTATLLGQRDSKSTSVEVASVETEKKHNYDTRTSSAVRLDQVPKGVEMKLSVVH